MSKNHDIISEETQQKQKNLKEKRIDDALIDLLMRVYFEDGGSDKFKTTEDLIVHFIEERLHKMPFLLQRKLTLSIKERNEPRRMDQK